MVDTIDRQKRRKRDEEIADYARANPDLSTAALGLKFELSKGSISVILRRQGVTKLDPRRKRYKCQECGTEFLGTQNYTGEKAKYCVKHRRRRTQQAS